MTHIERKAIQLISEYGVEMALTQARYHAGRTNGSLCRWWQAVCKRISVWQQPEQVAA